MIGLVMVQETSHITLKIDKATGVVNNSNIQGVAFNVGFIASKNPNLAVTILRLYQEASTIISDSPSQPEEDYSLAFEEIKKLLD